MTNPPSDETVYADDPEHPIPYLERLDVFAKKRDGGGDLLIVIATPLGDDRRSLERLMRKLENYLAHINSDEFRRESGPPSAENTRIVVDIDPGSSPAAFDLLERSKPWALENHATLVIKNLDEK